jgi:TPR repeat protein
MLMHSSIYAYWGWYWREVYHHIPLIVAQLLFVYALDMLVCWSRRDKWILGFGPFPIVLSTNLFLWFRDDWLILQFALVATGVLCKEFIKWERDGRRTHMFNPSAIALFIFSIGLLVTQNSTLTWGEEIATTLRRPPHIHVEIFVIGLIVQGLFSVTLVTLASAAALYVLNLAYTNYTGVYHFIDSNIPVAVFLGLHLLVTDPATSPRRTTGKTIFGALYGICVFANYGLLEALGAPRFYDKLLCVPLLNLTVRALDRFSAALETRPWWPKVAGSWGPAKLNYAHMTIWIALFAVMFTTGFVEKPHPGEKMAFWQQACSEKKFNACKTWEHTLGVTCSEGSASSCLVLARLTSEGTLLPRNLQKTGEGLSRACDLGMPEACTLLVDFVSAGGQSTFQNACDHHAGASCCVLGALYHSGNGVPKDDVRALALFRRSCAAGWWRGCDRLGESYLWGEGTETDHEKALENFERACTNHYAPSCYNLGVMYRRGMGVPQDQKLARDLFLQACDLGLQKACASGQAPAKKNDAERSGRSGAD